jgi:anti-sigma regulatory factor (Ser/Thr protein kinase)
MTRDEITLTLPRDRPYFGVARLVVGGLAARLDLPYEHLEDLQLALESVLATDAYAVAGDVTVELAVEDTAVRVGVGPLDRARLATDLESEEGIALGRLLRTTVEDVELEQRDGTAWVRFGKRIPGGAS